ncbi:MAG: hypothetical protein Q8M03_00100, partial [Legionella sp.]|nr:hypothetical protein [Legionella sp.]
GADGTRDVAVRAAVAADARANSGGATTGAGVVAGRKNATGADLVARGAPVAVDTFLASEAGVTGETCAGAVAENAAVAGALLGASDGRGDEAGAAAGAIGAGVRRVAEALTLVGGVDLLADAVRCAVVEALKRVGAADDESGVAGAAFGRARGVPSEVAGARAVAVETGAAGAVSGAVAFLVAELGVVVGLARVAVGALPETVNAGVVAPADASSCLSVVANSVTTAKSAGAAGAWLIASGAVESSGALVAWAALFVAAAESLGGRFVADARVGIQIVADALEAVGGAVRHEGEAGRRDGRRGRGQGGGGELVGEGLGVGEFRGRFGQRN